MYDKSTKTDFYKYYLLDNIILFDRKSLKCLSSNSYLVDRTKQLET